MVDMTYKDEDKKTFITDIVVNENGINVTYADGHVYVDTMVNQHNVEMYRYRMEKEASKHIEKFLDRISYNALFLMIRKYSVIVLSFIGLFMTYNFDIHLIMKIIITILGNLYSYILHSYYLWQLENMTDEAMCIDYFLKNRSKFTYKDEDGDDVDMLAIEEIGHYNLSFGTLKRIVEEADGMRETFGDDTEIKLSFQKNSDDMI